MCCAYGPQPRQRHVRIKCTARNENLRLFKCVRNRNVCVRWITQQPSSAATAAAGKVRARVFAHKIFVLAVDSRRWANGRHRKMFVGCDENYVNFSSRYKWSSQQQQQQQQWCTHQPKGRQRETRMIKYKCWPERCERALVSSERSHNAPCIQITCHKYGAVALLSCAMARARALARILFYCGNSHKWQLRVDLCIRGVRLVISFVGVFLIEFGFQPFDVSELGIYKQQHIRRHSLHPSKWTADEIVSRGKPRKRHIAFVLCVWRRQKWRQTTQEKLPRIWLEFAHRNAVSFFSRLFWVKQETCFAVTILWYKI